jgi:MG2 domain
LKKNIGLVLFALLVLSPFAFLASSAEAQRNLPPNRPERGLVYDGLEVPHDGSCKGAFRVKSNVNHPVCSHGPDVAPATMSMSAVAPVTTTPPPVVCDGDGTTGKRVQVIYAHAATVADQYATYKTSFQQWAADADADYNLSAQETGGTRHVRFVTDPACMPVVLDVALSATGANDFGTTINELTAQGYNRSDRRYMLFVDAGVYCGISNVQYDDQPGASNINNAGPEYARIDGGCWSGVIAAHELMHTLGGVQLSAPHSDANWHCYDSNDIMCNYSGIAKPTPYPCAYVGDRFDCNHDDYYSTNPHAGSYLAKHWNMANNQFLINPSAPAPTPFVDSMQTGALSSNGAFTPATTFAAGSTVTARAHVVDQTGRKLPGAAVTLSFKRPDGSVQCTVTATTDSSGTAQGSCATPSNAPKGSWSLHPESVTMSTMTSPSFSSVGDYKFTIQ